MEIGAIPMRPGSGLRGPAREERKTEDSKTRSPSLSKLARIDENPPDHGQDASAAIV
jgi:hypothetical protein